MCGFDNDSGNEDEDEDEDEKGDKDNGEDDDEDSDGAESKSEKEMQEFYDLLKQTASEDVKIIDKCLRDEISSAESPPPGLASEVAVKVWQMARKLTSLGDQTVEVGKKLQYFGASQTAWGKCFTAAEIAGELLRERLVQFKSRRPRRKSSRRSSRSAVASYEDGATYFAKRMAPLVDDDGRCVKKVTGGDAKLVTFFNKELKQAYINLVLQIKASNAMAELSSDTVFLLDGEVKVGAVTTDDTRARYETAVDSTYASYPLVVDGGSFMGCQMLTYPTFRGWVKVFLSVYKEFILRGEVVFEKVVEKDVTLYSWVENGFGYRVRGGQQQQIKELHYSFWGKQLFEKKMPDLKSRVAKSQKHRAEMLKKAAKQSLVRAATAASARATKTLAKTAAKVEERRKKKAVIEAKKGRKRKRSTNGSAAKKKTKLASATIEDSRSSSVDGSDSGHAVASDSNDMVAESVEEEEAPDPLQIRSSEFDYTLLTEPSLNSSFFSAVMMKPRQKPREETMKEELEREDARDHVGQYVTVGTDSGRMYIDCITLTDNLHGKQSKEQRKECCDTAEKRGVVSLSIPGRSSYLSRNVNVLYDGTAEYQRLMGDFDPDMGAVFQGVSQYTHSGSYTEDTAKVRIVGRGNMQFTVGISNHNFGKAREAESGEVALIDVQNEKNLHKYFPDHGRVLGLVVAKLCAVRDALTKERGDVEYDDEIRNQLFSGRVGEMFDMQSLGCESITVALTGRSESLDAMAEVVLQKLSGLEQEELRNKWESGAGVETADHGDSKNPDDPAYSRVVLGKWRIHLTKDRDGDFIVVTVIANHRRSVSTYEAKMKGIRGLSGWIEKQFESRKEEPDHVEYDADGDYLAYGGVCLRLGFVKEETMGIHKESLAKFGPGGFVSYSRPLSSQDQWRRHRDTCLQIVPGDDCTRSGRKRKRAETIEDGDDAAVLASDEELVVLERRSLLHGELITKRADFDRCADFSGCVWAAEELRDRFELRREQARELAMCIFWHTRSRAVFLLKSQAILQDGSCWAKDFAKHVGKGPGHVGSYIMNMINPKLMGRLSAELIRAQSFHIVMTGEEDDFTPEFVKEQCDRLKEFLRSSAKLGAKAKTVDFLNNNLDKLRHIGKFVLPQVLPICYLLGLVNCHPLRAAETPILDTGKAHYQEFLKLGVDADHFDLTMLVVALQFGTVPKKVENTGCEGFRKQLNVLDFMLKGQMFYLLRPQRGCNYKNPGFVVYVKKWGSEGVWIKAVRDANGRWRHPA